MHQVHAQRTAGAVLVAVPPIMYLVHILFYFILFYFILFFGLTLGSSRTRDQNYATAVTQATAVITPDS